MAKRRKATRTSRSKVSRTIRINGTRGGRAVSLVASISLAPGNCTIDEAEKLKAALTGSLMQGMCGTDYLHLRLADLRLV